MTKLIYLLMISTLLSQVNCAFALSHADTDSDQSSYQESKLKLTQIAHSLGMTPSQYLKFYAAVLGLEKAEKLGPGFAIEAHPAFIQFKQHLINGERASNALLDELESVYTEYRTGLARYSELTLEEFAAAETKIAKIDKSLVDMRKESQSTTVNEDDDSIVFEVIRDEDGLEESDSADFEKAAEIHVKALSLLKGGPSVDVLVRELNAEGDFLRSQPWRVTNSFAAPLGNIQGGAPMSL